MKVFNERTIDADKVVAYLKSTIRDYPSVLTRYWRDRWINDLSLLEDEHGDLVKTAEVVDYIYSLEKCKLLTKASMSVITSNIKSMVKNEVEKHG